MGDSPKNFLSTLIPLSICTVLSVSVPSSARDAARTLRAEAKTSTAEVYISRKEWVKAEALLRKAYADAADYPKASQLLGYALFQQKKISEAIPFLKTAVENEDCPDRATTLLLLGNALRENSTSSEAVPYLERSVALNPNDFNTQKTLWFTYREAGNVPGAIKIGKNILKRFPGCSDCSDLKTWLASENDHSLALSSSSSSTQSAVPVKAKVIPAEAPKGSSFDDGVDRIERKDFEGAITCFTSLLTKNPGLTSARINLGIAYAGLAMQRDDEKRFEEAESNFKQALEIRREIPDKHTLDAAVKNYAAMLRDLGRESEAKKVENQL